VEPIPEILEWGLGAGETAVLSLCRQKTAIAVVDDRAARVACTALSIRYTGTRGIVLRAHREGHVKSAKEILKALCEAGFYIDDDTVRSALLKATGETWRQRSAGRGRRCFSGPIPPRIPILPVPGD
jgi:predicted nucleic acid-binding protein